MNRKLRIILLLLFLICALSSLHSGKSVFAAGAAEVSLGQQVPKEEEAAAQASADTKNADTSYPAGLPIYISIS
jgi:hypothetical protein